jgi:hypothetical protein
MQAARHLVASRRYVRKRPPNCARIDHTCELADRRVEYPLAMASCPAARFPAFTATLVLSLAACRGGGAQTERPSAQTLIDASPAADAQGSAPQPTASESPRSAPPTVVLPEAATCSADDDCGWDDPCTPSACGAKNPAPAGVHCGRPATPGACRCAGGTCALVRPESAKTTQVACTKDPECTFDAPHGVCVQPTSSVTTGTDSGIGCVCDFSNHACVPTWRGEVACRTYRDCSWSKVNDSVAVPVPSWFTPRKTKGLVRPCVDAERDAVCEDGTCRVIAWKC